MQHRWSWSSYCHFPPAQVGRQRNSIRKNVRDHGRGVDHPFCASVSVLSPLCSPPLILLAVPLVLVRKAHILRSEGLHCTTHRCPGMGRTLNLTLYQPTSLPAYHIHITDPWVMANAPVPMDIGRLAQVPYELRGILKPPLVH